MILNNRIGSDLLKVIFMIYLLKISVYRRENNMEKVLFGLDTFGDIPANDKGELLSDAQAICQVVAEGVLADQLGVDIIALGEHHREDFAISSPEMVLAAIATQTEKIKLSTGVTVLSSDDPVRVFQRFSTLDALSNGRAQVMLGRGSFTESFPLFGFDLNDYDVLFEEKINLFSQLLTESQLLGKEKRGHHYKMRTFILKLKVAI